MTHYLPSRFKGIYNETHTALSSNLPVRAGVGIRSLVEAVCQEREAQGSNLKLKIEDLVKQGFLTQSGAEILQKLRLMGNEAVHEMKSHLIASGTRRVMPCSSIFVEVPWMLAPCRGSKRGSSPPRQGSDRGNEHQPRGRVRATGRGRPFGYPP